MKRWTGRWLMMVGVVHCIFGAVVFSEPLAGMLGDGLWNAVDGHPGRPLAFWFELVGLLTILLGALVDWLEKEIGRLPAFLGYGFVFINVLAIVAMPLGGGWLLVPASIGLLARGRTAPLR